MGHKFASKVGSFSQGGRLKETDGGLTLGDGILFEWIPLPRLRMIHLFSSFKCPWIPA